MRHVYTHIVCDIPNCTNSWDGNPPSDDKDWLPDHWYWICLEGNSRAGVACSSCKTYIRRVGAKR